MTDGPSRNALDVRNAVFEAANGKSLDEVLQGLMMAQGAMVADTCDGDEAKARDVLRQYHGILMGALPIYCALAETGQSHPS